MGKDIEKFTGSELEKVGDNQVGVESESTRAQMEVQAQVVMAKKMPRNEITIRQRIIDTCKRRPFAEKGIYSFPRGGRDIIGPSINLAKEMARLWGNIVYGAQIVEESDDKRTVRGFAWDLESNTREFDEAAFKKLIYRKKDGWIVPDERDLRELTNKHSSILKRNAILNILPADFVQEAVDTCLKTLSRSSAIKPDAIVDKFAEIGVTRKTLEEFLKHPIEETNEHERARLQGIYNSIKDGNSRPEEYFNGEESSKSINAEVKEGLFNK